MVLMPPHKYKDDPVYFVSADKDDFSAPKVS
jgi:hypothetical protein